MTSSSAGIHAGIAVPGFAGVGIAAAAGAAGIGPADTDPDLGSDMGCSGGAGDAEADKGVVG